MLRESFVDAIKDTMRFGIIFALIAGIVGWILVPKRQRQTQMQWEDGKPVEQPSARRQSQRFPPMETSANGVSANGVRELAPIGEIDGTATAAEVGHSHSRRRVADYHTILVQ